MFQLVYHSRPSRSMTDADLAQILDAARKNNPAMQVTGMLLFAGGTFFQLLEGNQGQVERLYDKIFADDRHHRVKRLHEGNAAARSFPNWSMGYQKVVSMRELPDPFFRLSTSTLEDRIPRNASKDLVHLMKCFSEAKLSGQRLSA